MMQATKKRLEVVNAEITEVVVRLYALKPPPLLEASRAAAQLQQCINKLHEIQTHVVALGTYTDEEYLEHMQLEAGARRFLEED